MQALELPETNQKGQIVIGVKTKKEGEVLFVLEARN